MAMVKEEQRKFGEKEARETLVREWERNIWIDQALEIPEAKQQIVEQVLEDEEAKQQLGEQFARDDEFMKAQLGEELFKQWKARQQAQSTPAPTGGSPEAQDKQAPPPPKQGRGARKKP